MPVVMTLTQASGNANKINAAICAATIDREVEVALGIVALIAKQHLLLLGPPGVAKTRVSYLLGQAIGSEHYFEKLLSRFTVPAEIFGPLSVKKLMEEEKYENAVEGFLPTARLAVADEVYKSSSAILNSLLTIINERVYHNGRVRMKVPLETLIGCSNEMPEDPGLAALHDRFLLRHEVGRISEGSRDRLLMLDVAEPTIPAFVGLPVLQAACPDVSVPPDVREGLLALVRACLATGIEISDRRIRQSKSLVQAHAVRAGRLEAERADLAILRYCFWATPDQIPMVAEYTQAVVQGRAPRVAPPAPAPAPRAPQSPSRIPAAPPMQAVPPQPTAPSAPAQMTSAIAAIATSPTAGLVAEAMKIIQTSGVRENVQSVWLHTAIDVILARSDTSIPHREMVAEWKNGIQKNMTPLALPWLAQGI